MFFVLKSGNLAAPDGLIRWGLFYSIDGYVLHFFFSVHKKHWLITNGETKSSDLFTSGSM